MGDIDNSHDLTIGVVGDAGGVGSGVDGGLNNGGGIVRGEE